MTRHALIVGIAEYASFQALEKATGDAEAVAEVLENYGQFDTIKRLPEGWNAREQKYYVTSQNLTGKQLGETLRTFLVEQAAGQEALIYFSGHGFKTADSLGRENGYLATSDCSLVWENKAIVGQQNGISLDNLNDAIADARLRSLILLLDCCHSGYFIEQSAIGKKLSVFNKTLNYYLIASSRHFEESYVGKEHSVFTEALLEALSRKYADREGNISCNRLFGEIDSQLKRSGQQPISMGVGTSMTLVSYPPPRLDEFAKITVNRENPYVGLAAFDAEKSLYFFGREKVIQDVQLRLHQGRFLSVIGASGSGKSSLIQAGLLPLLNREYAISSFTPGYNPPRMTIERLTALQERNQPFILFIDQFEEVFTLCKDDELRKSFFHSIAGVVKDLEHQGQIIIAIRGDFLDRCAEYPEIAALVNETQPTTYMVEPLSLEELYRAIAQPAKLHGVTFQGGLVEQMAREVAEQPGALPLLQYALRELWRVGIEEAQSETAVLTWEEYNQIGGVGGALDKKADLIYNSFTEERDCALIRRLLLELVELGEGETVTRRRVTQHSLAAQADSPEQLERVLDCLVQSRLVAMTLHKIGEENYEPYLEVTHEALLSKWGKLRDWISQNRDNLRRKRRFEGYFGTWYNAGKPEEALLSGLWLSDAEELRGQQEERLSPQEREFIDSSIERRDRVRQEKLERERQLRQAAEANAETERKLKLEAQKTAAAEQKRRQEAETRVKVQKQRTQFAAAAGILATLALGLGITAQSFDRAKTEREKVAAGALIGQAQTLLDTNNQLEALIASIQALKELKRLELRDPVNLENIASIINEIREKNRLEDHQEILTTLAFSPDGKTLISGDDGGKIFLWNVNNGIFSLPRRLEKRHTKTLWTIRFSPDGNLFASAGQDSTINIWNRRGDFKISLEGHKETVRDIAFSKDNKLASVSRDGQIKIWDIRNGKEIGSASNTLEFNRSSTINRIDFNPVNPSILVSTSSEGHDLYFWDLSNLKNIKKQAIGQNLASIMSVRSSRNQGMIVSCDNLGIVKLWNAEGKQIGQVEDISTNDPLFAEFSRDNQFIGVAKEDGSILIWTVEQAVKNFESPKNRDNRPYVELKGHKGLTVSISFSEGNTLASASYDKTIRIWDYAKDSQANSISTNLDDLLQKGCGKLKPYLSTHPENSLRSDKRTCYELE